MYLCICHAVTVAEVRQAAEAGPCDFDELVTRFSLGDDDSCGTCLSVLEDLLVEIAPGPAGSPQGASAAVCQRSGQQVACAGATAPEGTE